MCGRLNRSPLWLAGGLAAGLVLGVLAHNLLPVVPVQASATEGFDSFAIATGLADQSVEAVYFLDYLTGELKCAVVNPKTGKFSAFFNYNVGADFRTAGAAGGAPKYLLVTGLADMPVPRGGGNNQLGKSIVYIAEANSGIVAAYTIQWNPAGLAAGRPQEGIFRLLDIRAFRTTTVRDP
jgi:hypothetical protein